MDRPKQQMSCQPVPTGFFFVYGAPSHCGAYARRNTQLSNEMAENTRKPSRADYFEFEDAIAQLDLQIDELKRLSVTKGIDYATEMRQLEQKKVAELRQIYSNLSAWQTVQVARHPKRPLLGDFIDLMVKDFCELHGDRAFGDDRAIMTGFGHIGREKVLLVGQNKGRDTKEKIACNFGCANPEGFRKAMLKMKMAEKYGVPVVTIIDTPGAYPGVGAEERGIAQAIAVNLMEMSRLKVPIISIVIGEGCSGGALGVGVADRLAIMEFAYYSVISAEGCAAILWRDGSQAPAAAEAMRLTSRDLFKLKLVDAVIPEPLGGGHRNVREAVYNVEQFVVSTLRELKKMPTDKLVDARYMKLRSLGLGFDSAAFARAAEKKTALRADIRTLKPARPVRRTAVSR
jgi:acetyl-CoA carboxylase carboxyl transferase subunit alpha